MVLLIAQIQNHKPIAILISNILINFEKFTLFLFILFYSLQINSKLLKF